MSLSSAGLLTVSGRIITDDALKQHPQQMVQDRCILVLVEICNYYQMVQVYSLVQTLKLNYHVADDGLILKHVGTGDGKEPSFTFQAE